METGLQTVNQQRKLGEWAERVSACRSSGLRTWDMRPGEVYYKWRRRLHELAQNQQDNKFTEI